MEYSVDKKSVFCMISNGENEWILQIDKDNKKKWLILFIERKDQLSRCKNGYEIIFYHIFLKIYIHTYVFFSCKFYVLRWKLRPCYFNFANLNGKTKVEKLN